MNAGTRLLRYDNRPTFLHYDRGAIARMTGFLRLFTLFHWIEIGRQIMIDNREAVDNGLHPRRIPLPVALCDNTSSYAS